MLDFVKMKKYFLPVFIMALLVTSAAGQSWNTLNPSNSCTARTESAMAAVDQYLILLGGRGILPVERFSPQENKWIKMVEPPLEMHHFQAIGYNHEIWVLGAFTGPYPHETPIPNIYIFNPAKNEWRIGPEIPTERRRGAAGVFVYQNKIYLVCGIQDGHWDGHVGWLDEYDPKTDRWKTLPDAPHVRDHVQAVVLDNKVYIAGGRRSTARTNHVLDLTEPTVDVFDFKTMTWTTLPEALNLPTQRAGTCSVVWDKKVLVIGGESPSQEEAHNQVEAFNPKTMRWEKFPALQKGRHGTGLALFKGKIYMASGAGNRGGGPALSSLEVLNP